MARPPSDNPLDPLLRRSLREGTDAAGAVCPDADLLAAFTAGDLDRQEAARMEQHASSCARCARILSIVAIPDSPAAGDRPASIWTVWRGWGWAVPAATAATVAGLWFATTRPEVPSPSAPTSASRPEQDRAGAVTQGASARADATEARAADNVAVAALPPTAPPAAASADPRASAVLESPGAAPQAPEAAPQGSASQAFREEKAAVGTRPQPPAVRAEAGRAAPSAGAAGVRAVTAPDFEASTKLVRSPDGREAWRITGQTVEHSADDAATWATEYRADRPVTGGAAVSPGVAWFFGARGLVLRRTPQGWTAAALPVRDVEIAAIAPASAASALVTLADGRRFETADGGASWTER